MRSPVYRLVFSVRSKPTHRRRVEKKRRQKRNFAPLRDSALRSAKEVLLVAAPCCLPRFHRTESGMLVPQTLLRPVFLLCTIFVITTLPGGAQTGNGKAQDKTETIVCIRHGEKPPAGLGQLTCQGLNRALRLPQVLLTKYGKPDFIFAPDPNQIIMIRPVTSVMCDR